MSMALRSAPYHVIVDGQSLTVWPSLNAATSFPIVMRDDLGVPVWVAGVGGLSWQQLDNDFATRVAPYVAVAPVAVYVMVGGTTQVSLGQNASNLYASEEAIADLFLAACAADSITGYVVGTTTTPSTGFEDASHHLTYVAAGSNGVNVNTFAGAGVLNVNDATDFPSTGTLRVITSSSRAIIDYTGTTATTFTGCTTTSGSGLLQTYGTVGTSSGAPGVLVELNKLVKDNTAGWDAIVDLAADSRLCDANNTTYYTDGTHPTTAGNDVMAELIGAAVLTVI
jgi:hypothetical protein